MRTWLRSKVTLLFMMLGLLLAVPAIALADNLQDEIVTGSQKKTIATGAANSWTNDYFVQATGGTVSATGTSCNVDSANPVTFNLNVPSGVTASTTSLTFTGCGTETGTTNKVPVTFSSNTPGIYNITASYGSGGIGGSSQFNTNPSNLELTVFGVTTVTPADGATNVAVGTDVTANFSADPTGLSTSTFKLVKDGDVTNTSVPAAVTYNTTTNTATLNPTSDLELGTKYNATISGLTFDGVTLEDKTWSFTTVAPACTNPADPVFQNTTPNGDNGWFTSTPAVSATSSTSTAVVKYSDAANGTYSETVPTLGEGTTTVYAKAFSSTGTCSSAAVSHTYKVDTVAPSISDGGSWTQALPGNARTPDGNDSWYVSEVFNKFTASDATSGLVGQTSPYTFTKGSGTNQGSAVKISSGVISDMAGNTNSLDSAEYKIDLAAPTGVAGSPDRDPDSNGWYNHGVGFTFTGTDTVSGLASCSTPTYSGPDGTGKTVNGSCTDAAGNQSASVASSAIDYDATAPVIANVGADSTFSTPNAAGWYKTDVRHKFSATDNLSGFGTSGAATLNFSKDISAEGMAVTTSSGTQTDQAGNVATAITSSPAYKIDKTKPTVSVTGVSDGTTYTYGNVPTPGCNTTDALSDVKTNATVSVTGGTGGFGTLTATCSGAVDNADNAQDPVSATYKVQAAFNGFLQPIDGHSVNTGKYGRTYPIKWQLRDDAGNLISDSAAQLLVGTMTGGQKAVSCTSFDLADTDALEESTTGNTTLRYDATSDQFIYNYKAPSSGTCYVFAIRNADGVTTQQVDFKFTK